MAAKMPQSRSRQAREDGGEELSKNTYDREVDVADRVVGGSCLDVAGTWPRGILHQFQLPKRRYSVI